MGSHKRLRGMSLPEVVLASAILLVGILGIAGMFIYNFPAIAQGRNQLEATHLAVRLLEPYRNTPYALIGAGTIASGTETVQTQVNGAPSRITYSYSVTATPVGATHTVISAFVSWRETHKVIPPSVRLEIVRVP